MFELDEFLHNVERVRERTRRVAACIPAEQWSGRTSRAPSRSRRRAAHRGHERFIWAETVHHRPVRYTSHGRELAEPRGGPGAVSIGCTRNPSSNSARSRPRC